MSSWLETSRIITRIRELQAAGTPAALATVVRVRGSAYRRPGAKLLVCADGSSIGNVSGGCLELDVREVAHRVIRTGQPELRTYCSAEGDEVAAWDLGVGCDGEVEVLIQPVRDAWTLEAEFLQRNLPFAIRTVIEPLSLTRVVVNTVTCPSGIEDGVFIDSLQSPLSLVLFGAGDDVVPLARMAQDMGFRVAVVDHRPGLLQEVRFPMPIQRVDSGSGQPSPMPALDENTLAVVMTHNYADDRDYLSTLLATSVSYIGVLGPRRRTDRMLAALGVDNEERVFGPVGLDVGAEGAEQVAVAILAELLAVRAGRLGGSLRERTQPIHD
jgi:xanthine/CO dehydrogenase XdhC/CoxF family maturation factor